MAPSCQAKRVARQELRILPRAREVRLVFWRRMQRFATPYGASEALPVCDFLEELRAETSEGTAARDGVCVGRPFPR
jgi:hypothetical protein